MGVAKLDYSSYNRYRTFVCSKIMNAIFVVPCYNMVNIDSRRWGSENL